MAAGPTLWDALEARLGPYAPFAAEVEGEMSGQGLRLELVKAVSDGYTARVYYTLTDETGDRLNGHTQAVSYTHLDVYKRQQQHPVLRRGRRGGLHRRGGLPRRGGDHAGA